VRRLGFGQEERTKVGKKSVSGNGKTFFIGSGESDRDDLRIGETKSNVSWIGVFLTNKL
jgi:hypothetical protein